MINIYYGVTVLDTDIVKTRNTRIPFLKIYLIRVEPD